MKKRNRMSKLYWLIPLVTLVLWWAVGTKAGVVRNSTGTGYDSICVPFALLDTLGNPVAVDSALDWGCMVTYYPNGTEAVVDSFLLDASTNSCVRYTTSRFRNLQTWQYRKLISELDGTPENGTYSYLFVLRDSSLHMWTTYRGEFELYQTTTFATVLDQVKYDTDSLTFNASLQNPSFLRPTTAGRTLDVTATGEAGIDLDNTAGTLAKTTDITGFNDPDSALISRIARRMWGVQLGAAGSTDSLTKAQRMAALPVGDSVRKALGDSLATFGDSAVFARAVFDNDVVALANRTVTVGGMNSGVIDSADFAASAISFLKTVYLDYINGTLDSTEVGNTLKRAVENWAWNGTASNHVGVGSLGKLLDDVFTESNAMYSNGVKLLTYGTDGDSSFTNLQAAVAGISAGTADIYPLLGPKFVVDAVGADGNSQFVADTASLGVFSSDQDALINRAIVIRSLNGNEVSLPATINRVAYTAANCSLTVNIDAPRNFAAGDTIQFTALPWHDFATVSEASDSNAQALLLTDLTGNPQDSLVRGFIKSGGVAGSDTTAQKAMLTGMGVPRGLDSLASLSETATADGTLRRGEIVTARAAAETTSVVIADDSLRYPKGGVIDTARNASGLGGGSCTGDGAIAFNLYFIDTLGTDETVGDGHISLYTNSSCTGTPAYWGKTGALGYIPFSVDTGTYWACASKIASVNATSAQYFHVTASSSDSVLGYGFATSTRAVIDGIVQLPGGPDTVCAYCDVVFEMVTAGGNVRDTVLNTVVIPQAVTGYTLATGVPVQASGAPFELRKTQNLVSTVGQTKYAVKWIMKVTLNDGSIWQSNQFSINNSTDVVDIGEI